MFPPNKVAAAATRQYGVPNSPQPHIIEAPFPWIEPSRSENSSGPIVACSESHSFAGGRDGDWGALESVVFDAGGTSGPMVGGTPGARVQIGI